MYKYKTTDGSDRVVPGIGETVNGVIETEHKIESPVFELVEPTPAAPAQPQNGVVGTAPNQPANAVNQATPAAPAAPSKPNEEQ